MFKKIFVIVIGTCLMFSSCVYADAPIKISLDGAMIENQEYSPCIDENNRILISIRCVADEMNYTVDWNECNQIATIKDGTDLVKLQRNSSKILKNNVRLKMDTIPVLKNSRLFIPLRYLSQCFGFEVEWNKNTNTVYIINPDKILFKDENFGVFIPEGLNKSEMKTVINKYENYTVVEIQDSLSNGLLFSLSYFDLSYWEKEVKANFPAQYEVLYEDDKNILICISVSDIQYNSENIKEKEHYLKLFHTKEQICNSLFILNN